MKVKIHRLRTSWLVGLTVFMVVVMVVLILLYVKLTGRQQDNGDKEQFSRYYVMIADDTENSFTRALYEETARMARENGVYVELMGDNLTQKYTIEQYMEIAIASKVDGIIVKADDSREMTELIDTAVSQDIPVLTLFSDNKASLRSSFVGINSYDLGCMYGEQINTIINEREFSHDSIKVTVLLNSISDTGQNLTYSTIKDTMVNEQNRNGRTKEVKLSFATVNTSNRFAVEESVRNVFITTKENVPDIIVCLGEEETDSCSQAVVDYNMVKQVSILGCFDSPSILNAVNKEVIYSTITVDTEKMGAFCIQALNEYHEFGAISQYSSADLTLINKENVGDYLQ